MKISQALGSISRISMPLRLKRPMAIASLLGLLSLQMCAVAHAAIPASERAVLTAFYTQTGGPGWITSTNWNGAEGTECTWYRVTCDSQGTHVVAIELLDDRLIGTLPALDGLPFLQVLNLRSERQVVGTCQEYGGCNLISGTVPALSALTALTQFDIRGNTFTGTIPDVSALINLQEFDVGQNQLSGSIPALAGLSKLDTFNADQNQLTGPLPELQGLANLATFSVEGNQLTGSIPELSTLSSLQTFDVSGNRLTGEIPSLTGLNKLVNFSVDSNQLTAAIPALEGLVNLYLFSVINNQLVGSIPAISGLKALYWFDISNNQVSGSIPALPGSISLFAARNNQLSGEIPPLPNKLQVFAAENNQLTGSIPPFAKAGALGQFYVNDNQLTGPIPSLSGSDVYWLNVSNNRLTGQLPNFSDASLQSFIAANNQLTGTIPSIAGTGLRSIDVSNNGLTGALPGFSGARSLEYFAARNNHLTGAIPKLDENYWSYFDVSNNRLTGAIPDLAGLQYLNFFDVGFNQLSGTVPAAPELSSGYRASLCPNLLVHTPSAEWDAATLVSPWYRDCVSSFVNLDQFGLTGTWFNPPTSGQGLNLEVLPDLLGAGQGFLFGGWFTYDSGTQPYGQRWYILQGAVSSSNASATVDIVAPAAAGNFDALPTVSGKAVGKATIAFSDCDHGTLDYTFFQGRSGAMPLSRLTPNTSCTLQGDSGAAATNSLLSGNWYDPATSGQGLVFDIVPSVNVLFAGWFTYARNGIQSESAGTGSERWYTLQTNTFVAGSTSVANVPIIETTGGSFNVPVVPTSVQVGTADIAFQSCTQMTLHYVFTSGDNQGLSRTINLFRLGPAPAGCSL